MEFLAALAIVFWIALLVTLGYVATTTQRSRRAQSLPRAPSFRNERDVIHPGWFFGVLILILLVSSFWIDPVGPIFWGVAWVPLLVVASMFALIIAAFTMPVGPIGTTREPGEDATLSPEERRDAAAGANVFLWMLIAFLIVGVALSWI